MRGLFHPHQIETEFSIPPNALDRSTTSAMLGRLLRRRAEIVATPNQSLSERPPIEWIPSGVSNPRRWTIVGLLFSATVINYLDRGTLSVALPMIARELSLTAFQKGLLLWSFFTFYSVIQIPVG